jgi:hypothetical protein
VLRFLKESQQSEVTPLFLDFGFNDASMEYMNSVAVGTPDGNGNIPAS